MYVTFEVSLSQTTSIQLQDDKQLSFYQNFFMSFKILFKGYYKYPLSNILVLSDRTPLYGRVSMSILSVVSAIM